MGMIRVHRQDFARHLRRNPTLAEMKLWGALRKRCLAGFRFNRQATIGPYVVDFLCRDMMLAVEVDGATHGDANEVAYDERRTRFLEACGYVVFRASNADIYENLGGVLECLENTLLSQQKKLARKAPSPLRGAPPSLRDEGA